MKQVRRLKEEKMKLLKLCLQKNSQVEIIMKYFVRLRIEVAHHGCHLTRGKMGFS